MNSLSKVYSNKRGPGLRRLYVGVGLFLGGVLLLLGGIITAGTNLVTSLGYSLGEIRLWGGILGGIGVPAAMLGVFTVLPSSRTGRATAVVGSSLMVLGVALFYYAYPCHWIGATCGAGLTDMTFPTAGIYFLGAATSLWALFVSVANFKTRNDPGGTAEITVNLEGETRVVEVDRSRLSGLGSVGFLGATPSDPVQTQTNTPDTTSDGGTPTETVRSPGGGTDDAEVLDSGAGSQSLDESHTPQSREDNSRRESSVTSMSASTSVGTGQPGQSSERASANTPQAESARNNSQSSAADDYCGTCQHFRYEQSQDGLEPYCGLHEERMDSMDACEEWSAR
ncbi:MAG: hypothetical protein A07HR60_01666 [uncultured archaeon A07HR60]|jgi:hypothetical protein|nr:MAG: hypothetical protein A07HR60_01666 [uncultured archaeon A07HR60]